MLLHATSRHPPGCRAADVCALLHDAHHPARCLNPLLPPPPSLPAVHPHLQPALWRLSGPTPPGAAHTPGRQAAAVAVCWCPAGLRASARRCASTPHSRPDSPWVTGRPDAGDGQRGAERRGGAEFCRSRHRLCIECRCHTRSGACPRPLTQPAHGVAGALPPPACLSFVCGASTPAAGLHLSASPLHFAFTRDRGTAACACLFHLLSPTLPAACSLPCSCPPAAPPRCAPDPAPAANGTVQVSPRTPGWRRRLAVVGAARLLTPFAARSHAPPPPPPSDVMLWLWPLASRCLQCIWSQGVGRLQRRHSSARNQSREGSSRRKEKNQTCVAAGPALVAV